MSAMESSTGTSATGSSRRRKVKIARRAVLAASVTAAAAMIGIRFFVLDSSMDVPGKDAVMPPPPNTGYPVVQFEDLGRIHLASGEAYAGYNSAPPTSGPHAPRPAEFKIHREPVAREQLVHSMEHGGVVVWYNCEAGPAPLSAEACTGLRDQLEATVRPYLEAKKLVVLVPSPDSPARISLTAWTILDSMDSFDEARVQSFLDVFIRRFNPEKF